MPNNPAAAAFDAAADALFAETAHLSSIHAIQRNRYFVTLAAQGEAVVAPALRRLAAGTPGCIALMTLLAAVTGASPVPPEDRGRVERMVAAWLAWGTERGDLA